MQPYSSKKPSHVVCGGLQIGMARFKSWGMQQKHRGKGKVSFWKNVTIATACDYRNCRDWADPSAWDFSKSQLRLWIQYTASLLLSHTSRISGTVILPGRSGASMDARFSNPLSVPAAGVQIPLVSMQCAVFTYGSFGNVEAERTEVSCRCRRSTLQLCRAAGCIAYGYEKTRRVRGVCSEAEYGLLELVHSSSYNGHFVAAPKLRSDIWLGAR